MFLKVLTQAVLNGNAKLRLGHVPVNTDQDSTGFGRASHQGDDQLSVCRLSLGTSDRNGKITALSSRYLGGDPLDFSQREKHRSPLG